MLPVYGLAVPVGQVLQELTPGVGLYLPDGHELQADALLAL